MDKEYCKQTFKLNWPFCVEISAVLETNGERYWKSLPLSLDGKSFLVCSQWYRRNRKPFCNYLLSKGIIREDELFPLLVDAEIGLQAEPNSSSTIPPERTKVVKGRYQATTEGDAANLVIRAILSNLGTESFSDKIGKQQSGIS
jgi:hypothetical protein